MPALVCVPPAQFKRMLELDGYEVINEDSYNWIMARGHEVPVSLPKRGQYVSVDLTMQMVLQAPKIGQGRYIELVNQTGGFPGYPEFDPDSDAGPTES